MVIRLPFIIYSLSKGKTFIIIYFIIRIILTIYFSDQNETIKQIGGHNRNFQSCPPTCLLFSKVINIERKVTLFRIES